MPVEKLSRFLQGLSSKIVKVVKDSVQPVASLKQDFEELKKILFCYWFVRPLRFGF